MTMIAIGHSEDPNTHGAIREILTSCQEQLKGETPVAGLLFSSIDADHKLCVKSILEKYPGLTLIGCTTDGEATSMRGFQEDSI